MADSARIWIDTTHHTAFRCGGWAFLLHDGKGLSGMAGGDRNTTDQRIALTGLIAALKDAPSGAAVQVLSADKMILGLPRRIAGFAAEPPRIDLELWAQIDAALKARPVTFAVADRGLKTPIAFAAAWAELARDKAKATGPFKSAIPRTNLAKAGV